jgi:hypothetical protein
MTEDCGQFEVFGTMLMAESLSVSDIALLVALRRVCPDYTYQVLQRRGEKRTWILLAGACGFSVNSIGRDRCA